MARTQGHRPSLPVAQGIVANKTVDADLSFLKAWEATRPMDLGVMLRIRQIRRAQRGMPSQGGGTKPD